MPPAPAAARLCRAQRFPLRAPLQYRKSGVEYWQDGKTVNISRTGILFKTDEKIPPAAILDVRICLPLNAIISCQGPVVRAEESAVAIRIHRYHLAHA